MSPFMEKGGVILIVEELPSFVVVTFLFRTLILSNWNKVKIKIDETPLIQDQETESNEEAKWLYLTTLFRCAFPNSVNLLWMVFIHWLFNILQGSYV